MSRDVSEHLTADEHEAVYLLGQAAGVIRRIIGDGPTAAHDWVEAAGRIHDLQHMVMSQAAARAYPDMYRLLGRSLRGADR